MFTGFWGGIGVEVSSLMTVGSLPPSCAEVELVICSWCVLWSMLIGSFSAVFAGARRWHGADLSGEIPDCVSPMSI